MKRLFAATAALAVLACGEAHAQPLTRNELLQALKARDDVIAALQQRVAALERGQAATAQAASPTQAAPLQTASGPPIATLPGTPRTADPPAATTATQGDEEELQALSRALVQRGGMVLPPWRVEVVPAAAYSARVVQGLALVQTPEGIPTVANQRLRDDQARALLALRVGLPWSSQIEVRAPYNWLRRSRALGDGDHAANDGSALGDVELALSHQFFRESGWRPDLVAGVAWRIPTGRDPFTAPVEAVATGSGFHEVRGRLTAVKSSDPLVFFGTLAYAHELPRTEDFGRIQPGDAIGLDLGAVLSLSPESSLTFSLSQEWRGRNRLDGVGMPGTDSIPASLGLGFQRVLAPNVLVDVSLGVGLTRDAPDYVVQVSLPIRVR